jgi:hypothetical protein
MTLAIILFSGIVAALAGARYKSHLDTMERKRQSARETAGRALFDAVSTASQVLVRHGVPDASAIRAALKYPQAADLPGRVETAATRYCEAATNLQNAAARLNDDFPLQVKSLLDEENVHYHPSVTDGGPHDRVALDLLLSHDVMNVWLEEMRRDAQSSLGKGFYGSTSKDQTV